MTLLCKPINGWPCLRYDPTKPDELNQFLTENGGKPARFEADKVAHLLTKVKDEDRFMWVKPGCWVRCLGPAQFTACTDKKFTDHYELLYIQ